MLASPNLSKIVPVSRPREGLCSDGSCIISLIWYTLNIEVNHIKKYVPRSRTTKKNRKKEGSTE